MQLFPEIHALNSRLYMYMVARDLTTAYSGMLMNPQMYNSFPVKAWFDAVIKLPVPAEVYSFL